MSVQRFDLYRATPTVVGHVNTIHLINQSVTGPAGADGAGVSVATKEGGTTKVAVTTVLDFDGTNFDVTGSSGTASIVIAAGQYATAAQGSTADTAVQPARSISTTAPLTGGGDLSANRTLAISAASDTAAGVVELATSAETITGTDTARAVTPAGGAAAYVPKALVDAKGDLLVASADNTPARLAVGTDGHVLTADAAEATGVKWAAAAGGGGGGYAIFGDGSDGTVTISTTVTLTRDMFYDVLTVQSGGVLATAGYRVFCKTSCTVDSGGTIRNDGTAASGRFGGAGAPVGSVGSTAGGGPNGPNSAGAGSAGTNVTVSLGGAGGAGGTSGTGAGGAGGTATAPGATFGGFRSTPFVTAMKAMSNGGTTSLSGGAGGGSGGVDVSGGQGGGGGGGGGVVVIAAKAITNNGTISANGHSGGVAPYANGSGGGGGGGGVVALVYNTFTGSAATATGGAGGAGQGTGPAGSAGSSGTVITVVNA